MKSNQDSGKLRQLRKSAGLSQWKIARSLGKTQGWLSNIECGYVHLTDDLARKLVAAIKRIGSDSDR